jgi:hypothetical protein
MSQKEADGILNAALNPAPTPRCPECARRENRLRELARKYRHDYARYMKEADKFWNGRAK